MGSGNSGLVDTRLFGSGKIPPGLSAKGKGSLRGKRGSAKFSPHSSLGILPIAKSSFGVLGVDEAFGHVILDWVKPDVKIGGFNLPGHGDAYGDCGHTIVRGCLNVEAHNQSRIDEVDVIGKIFVRVARRSCFRAECPVCYEKWAGKEAHKIEYRLDQWKTRGKVIHLVISPPRGLWYEDFKKLRRKAYIIAKKVRFLGGSCIFHPFRQLESTKQWYFSPHFHMLGYGWIKGVAESFEESGWVAVNLGVRDSVHATAMYQLSHGGIHKKHHTVTWFGKLSYNKLKVIPEVVEKEVCPLCGSELVKLEWMGDEESSVLSLEGDFFVDPGGWMKGVSGGMF